MRAVVAKEVQPLIHTQQMRECGYAAASVAAHRAQAAITIVIVHLKVIAFGSCVERHQPVGAHTETTANRLSNKAEIFFMIL